MHDANELNEHKVGTEMTQVTGDLRAADAIFLLTSHRIRKILVSPNQSQRY